MFGEMRSWQGRDTFIVLRCDGEAVHELEIKTGSLIWLPEEGGVVYDTITTPYIDPRIIPGSRSVGWVTRDQYRFSLKEKRDRECPANVPVIKTEANAPAHLAPLLNLGVKFF